MRAIHSGLRSIETGESQVNCFGYSTTTPSPFLPRSGSTHLALPSFLIALLPREPRFGKKESLIGF
ncbi:hypothetical protein E2C01_093661 [Portunus trituberculatus]|uniref:Uncharacterized protein n=1 Tax=Portunus trituberculatus TaxID=210409 RepID=A0A5B7JZB8_PORTR|nr:hypothetical protein [Portunus trituberculatus]